MVVVWDVGEFDGASWGRSGSFWACKVPCRPAKFEPHEQMAGLVAATCISASNISGMDFPLGNWKVKYEADFPQGSNLYSSVKTMMVGLVLQDHQGSIYCAAKIMI